MSHILNDAAVAEIERAMKDALGSEKKLKFIIAFDTDFKVCVMPFIPEREDANFTERFAGWAPAEPVYPELDDKIDVMRGKTASATLLGWIRINGHLYCG